MVNSITRYMLTSAMLFIHSSSAFTQCEYDLNNDGIVNMDSDYLLEISQFGLHTTDLNPGESLIADHNQNEMSDIRDVIEFLPHLVSDGCLEIIDYPEGIGQLVLTEHYIHPVDLADPGNLIPAGAITYRLYLHVNDPEMVLMAVYGDQTDPLNISSSGDFFQCELPDGTTFYDGIAEYNVPILFTFYPTLEYNSWLTLDYDPTSQETINMTPLSPFGNSWWGGFLDGDDILIDSPAGGGLVTPEYFYMSESNNPQLKLIGQFTVINADDLNGSLSVLLRNVNFMDEIQAANAYLSFNEDNIQVLGCTNPLALNYNPDATFDNGSCALEGDLDNDGNITMSDLLLLLSNFGCNQDCFIGDFNNDNMVNIDDLLAFLGWV